MIHRTEPLFLSPCRQDTAFSDVPNVRVKKKFGEKEYVARKNNADSNWNAASINVLIMIGPGVYTSLLLYEPGILPV